MFWISVGGAERGKVSDRFRVYAQFEGDTPGRSDTVAVARILDLFLPMPAGRAVPCRHFRHAQPRTTQ